MILLLVELTIEKPTVHGQQASFLIDEIMFLQYRRSV